MIMNDEAFTIKNLAATIIGRLAIYNPAYVIPSLRITLTQVLKEFEYAKARYKI
jgi:FKBP12-rapamycin complex-associated protein